MILDFVKNWWFFAVIQHIIYGIPASITLAQGSLESSNGQSRLAKEGNNYFGIKAYDNPYHLPVLYANDDLVGEPFIKYSDPKQSFVDHSLLLQRYARYDSLFTTGNYKDWAVGLKKAGYATNPNYDSILIDLIEKNNLKKYDWIGNNKYIIFTGGILILGTAIFFIVRYFVKNRKK